MVKLESLKTLSQVESIKDVKPLAKTVFPGAHCPLFGSALILKGVTDALMIVIGTDECTYYTKKFSLGYDSLLHLDAQRNWKQVSVKCIRNANLPLSS